MKIIQRHKVEEEITGTVRLSDYAVNLFPLLSTKSSVKKAIKNGLILIDGKAGTSGTHISKGQIIELSKFSNTEAKIYQLKTDVIFEDEFIALINKPPGINVSGNEFKTIENALLFNIKKSKEEDALVKPKPVHRLDNQTSGLLIIAKTHHAQVNLGDQFEKKQVKKKYTAVVIGKTPEEGEINILVNDKEADTVFKRIKTTASLRFEYLTLIELNPISGRTHQLRIHCYKSGFPILGDKLYKNENFILKGKGLFLSSTHIKFLHPITKEELSFNISYPTKFDKIIEREKKRYESDKPKND